MSGEAPIVFLVDDDMSVLKAVTRLLNAEGFKTRSFSSPRSFLDEHDVAVPGCLVMDLAMPEINGLDLQNRLIASGQARPIIFVTGQGDIPSSVIAMKAGAVDFLTKPFNDDDLLSAVRWAIEKDEIGRRLHTERERLEGRLAALTPRERQVFERVIRGKLNKQIAGDLGIVEKTVKVHRARVMQKMGVRTLAALVQIAERRGIAG